MVVDGAGGDRGAKHFLEAQGLGAELEVGVPAVTPPELVFDWVRAFRAELYDIRPAAEEQAFGPQRNVASHTDATGHGHLAALYALMGHLALDGEDVLF